MQATPRQAKPGDEDTSAEVITRTQAWLLHAVIGLNLCPFAKSVYVKNQIAYRVSAARDAESLLDDLLAALQDLKDSDPEVTDTLLLIHPFALEDFFAFNDFLALADAVLTSLGLAGTFQIASFHPDYQFVDTDADDISNCTNRAPYPILHLLREASLDKSTDAFPDADGIVERNIATLQKLGRQGWQQLQQRILGSASDLLTPPGEHPPAH